MDFKELAEWLYNLSKKENKQIDIHADDEYIFKNAKITISMW